MNEEQNQGNQTESRARQNNCPEWSGIEKALSEGPVEALVYLALIPVHAAKRVGEAVVGFLAK